MLTSGSEELEKSQDPQAPWPQQGNAGLLWKEETTYPKGIKFRAKRKPKAVSSSLPILACLVHLPQQASTEDISVQRY